MKTRLMLPVAVMLAIACGGSSPTGADHDGVICTASMSPGLVITVQVPGYQEWKFVGLVVGHDECHVKTIRFSVMLTRMTDVPS